MKSDGSDLGATLVQSAKAPVRKACSHLAAAHVTEGLEALSHDNLLGGLREGIQEAAKRVRADPREVERVLPWNDLSPLLVRITSTHKAASEIWQKHADSVGGLFTGSAGGVADPKKQSAGEYLNSLAGRFARDKHLANPIRAFATDVLQWEEVIERCGDFVDHADLAAAYRRRRLIIFSAVGVVVLGGALGGGTVVSRNMAMAASRERVTKALASADPCAAALIPAEDMAKALPEQVAKQAELTATCAKQKERAKYERACEALAGHLEAGKITPDDEELLKSTVPMMKRVTRGALEVGDLLFPEASMPCQDVPKAADRLWKAYAKAASDSPAAWGAADKASDKLKSLLSGRELSLSSACKAEMSKRAESVGLKAIVGGKADELATAKALCDFGLGLGVEYGKYCTGVAKATEPKR